MAALRFCDECQVDVLVQRELERQGVDIDLVTTLIGPMCLFSVSFFDGGAFGFDQFGESAFVFIVTGDDAETELDLCAWSASEPEIFGTLLSQAPLLGADRVLNPATYYADQPCPLWRTPLRWLQEGCQGAVVVQAIPASVVLARAPGMFAAEDIEHADELVRSGAAKPSKLLVPKASLARRAAA